jgi:hypothetical protein
MTRATLQARVTALEQQVADLQKSQANGTLQKDWRRTIGAFTDDPELLEIFHEAKRIRDADRKRASRKRANQ